MVGWIACLGPLPWAQTPVPPACAGWLELTRACPDPASPWLEPELPLPEDAPGPCLWHPWALALAGGDCPCLSTLPGSPPAAPHWHGAKAAGRRKPPAAFRNLVVEVRPIELNDGSGSPRGTFR
jgi:hypothetical protein